MKVQLANQTGRDGYSCAESQMSRTSHRSSSTVNQSRELYEEQIRNSIKKVEEMDEDAKKKSQQKKASPTTK